MIKLQHITRWIGSKAVDIDGWELGKGDTREQANNRNVPESWSGLEVWKREEGDYIAFQTRMQRGKPRTFVLDGQTLPDLMQNMVADFTQHFNGNTAPGYWIVVFAEAFAKDKELGSGQDRDH